MHAAENTPQLRLCFAAIADYIGVMQRADGNSAIARTLLFKTFLLGNPPCDAPLWPCHSPFSC
jgi:hypothetical protein